MAQVELRFTEQFDGETVTVSIGDREVLRAEHLRTDMRTSRAQVAHIEVAAASPELTFELVPMGASATAVIDPSHIKFIAVSLSDSQLRIEVVTVKDYAREPRGNA